MTGTIACYCRVSTADQNLERQVSSVRKYAVDDLGADPGDLQLYQDKSTGTNTKRKQYRDMMEAVESGEVDVVVVHEISRMARSLRDLDRSVSRAVDNGVEVHFVRDGLVFGSGEDSPMDRLMLQMLGAFAEWEARVKRMNTKEGIAARQANDDYHHGPAPLGFEKDDGQLVEADDYDRVCAVLEMKAKGEMGTREAARELECGTATINRAIEERADLYGL
jgi:DNA invertase Pin-like site-specific DNA recombinase